MIAFTSVVAVLAIGGTALAGQLLDQTSGYTGCLTQNGDLLKFAEGDTPIKPCTGNQVQVHFGGDLASILAGTGLDGTTANSVVTLSVNQTYALPQGCEVGQVARWNGTSWECGNAIEPLP